MTDQGVTVARIQIHRLMLADGTTTTATQFDDGHDGGQIPSLVEALGMLEIAKVAAWELTADDDCDCDDEGGEDGD